MELILNFKYIALPVIIIWIIGVILSLFSDKKLIVNIGNAFVLLGIFSLSIFISILWIKLERAPMRTLGETRLWYSLFLSIIGTIMYYKWKVKWSITFSILLSILFLAVNLIHPENFQKTLMPALQSYWFVPHVIVYIFAYAILGAATLLAIKGLILAYKKRFDNIIITYADNLVYIGFSFLTFGLLFGALWAKEAWGSYWTWDPKETWSFITWLLYLLYIHYRYFNRKAEKTPLWLLSLAFLFLMICWFGINYLPTAANSVHTYSQG
ncbi:MAG: cytochrome c biogenesis protein CcsA [Bacteroidia bacterium]|nr:cytochrome c biogenesis protein CcsA [Bacteroidia bacterium]